MSELGLAVWSTDFIRSRIVNMRNVQVMLDSDLAEIYGVGVKKLNEQVKRNIERFPEKFRFQLSEEEFSNLRSQIVTLNGDPSLRSQIATLNGDPSLRSQFAILKNPGRGQHRKYLPYVFTEQGVGI